MHDLGYLEFSYLVHGYKDGFCIGSHESQLPQDYFIYKMFVAICLIDQINLFRVTKQAAFLKQVH